ncbi:hypothetical protein [Brevibacillus daliensis]|uniref:hypothetical protein n=1 Tax=Brevibacillus daliensis TaxID=2892995 RepID=UPI001E494325|nr:hypothetical protein [Brevibacillus daliensis]
MNIKQKKIAYYFLGTILAVTALSQGMKGNYLLAVFPCIGSISFFVHAIRMGKQ